MWIHAPVMRIIGIFGVAVLLLACATGVKAPIGWPKVSATTSTITFDPGTVAGYEPPYTVMIPTR